MTGSGTPGDAPRSGSGCATGLGFGLIVGGGLFLWANLAGTSLVGLLLNVLPLAAVWWPLLLVAWGAFKLLGRVRTGRTRFGIVEVLLLLLLIVGGTGLTLAQRVIESQGLQSRVLEISRWADEQAGPFRQFVFVSDQAVALPVGAFQLPIALPAGNIVVEAAPVAAGASNPPPTETPVEPDPGGVEREGQLQLVKRVWAPDRERAAARADAVRLMAGPLDPESGQFPVRVEDSGESEVALELLLTLPAGVSVSARTGKGSLHIEGPFSRVEAHTGEGPVEVRGTAGAVSISARDGAVRVSRIEGSLEVRARRAVVEAESVAGPITVESDGAPVWISNAESSVRVDGRNAPVGVAHTAGPVEIETRISAITLDRIGDSALVRTAYGQVLATSVEGLLKIRTESAPVEVRKARAGLEIVGDGGSVVIEDVLGPTTVTSGRGEVHASRLRGAAKFSGRAGAITVRGFEDTLSIEGGDALVDVTTDVLDGPVSLQTGRGEVRLTLPAAGSFALSAETASGEVESDFALDRATGEGRSRWTGSAGSGTPQVTISTERGDVNIRADQGPEAARKP